MLQSGSIIIIDNRKTLSKFWHLILNFSKERVMRQHKTEVQIVFYYIFDVYPSETRKIVGWDLILSIEDSLDRHIVLICYCCDLM